MIEHIPSGEYFIPNLRFQESPPIGKYGRMRKRYLISPRTGQSGFAACADAGGETDVDAQLPAQGCKSAVVPVGVLSLYYFTVDAPETREYGFLVQIAESVGEVMNKDRPRRLRQRIACFRRDKDTISNKRSPWFEDTVRFPERFLSVSDCIRNASAV